MMMPEIDPRPMQRIVKSVLRDLGNGAILDYYLRETWEPVLRNDFARLVMASASGAVDLEVSYGILRRLNYGYRTRYGLGSLRELTEVLFSLLERRGWWQRRPPSVLGSSDNEAEVLSSLPAEITAAMAAKGLPRPYSLSTKCLHFLFPDSFAICDQQAVASIQMWAYFAFRERDESWWRFSWGSMAKMDGAGYGGVIDFYRIFWSTATEPEREAVVGGASDISKTIGGHVSPVDVLDKLLWRANGDPALLGFSLA